jgi:protein-S-isoprenylcysteine O-methyltransferase Ste14
MLPQKIIAYTILALFFALDSFFRKGNAAISTAPTRDDNMSTRYIGLSFFIMLIISLAANFTQIGAFTNPAAAWAGVGLMVAGVCLRITSMRTLGRFYTRTLVTVKQQNVVQTGIYKILRHPGYLGTILIWCSAGLAMANVVVLASAAVLLLPAYVYRIVNEEKMLVSIFGSEYSNYMQRSWRLVPLVW